MTTRPRVIVHPPSPTGGRPVQIGEESTGPVHGVAELVEVLERAGLDLTPEEAARSRLIEWRGGGPGVWAESPP